MNLILVALERNWKIYLHMDGGRAIWCFSFGSDFLTMDFAGYELAVVSLIVIGWVHPTSLCGVRHHIIKGTFIRASCNTSSSLFWNIPVANGMHKPA